MVVVMEYCVTRILLPGVSVIIGQLLRIIDNSLPKEKDLAIYFTKTPSEPLSFIDESIISKIICHPEQLFMDYMW